MSKIKKEKYILKVLFVGDSGVGKTNILRCYINEPYMKSHISTIGVDLAIQKVTIGENKVKMNLWDTAGQERFRAITTSYYRNANLILLVFDICNKKSFENLDKWLEEIKLMIYNNECVIVLVGNKKDKENYREVTTEMITEYIKDNNIDYFEVSAKDEDSVKNIFLKTLPIIINKITPKNDEKNIPIEKSICC